MARPCRFTLPGVAVHIVQRGNNRGACFRQESDYLTYLGHLRYLSQRHGCRVHAYCLMTNHVHLLLTPEHETSCTKLMQDLGRRYVRYFNSRHHRTGTLWEGRFRSCIAQSSLYVLACYRYVELNPVRAAMASDAGSYPWSSYAVNSGARADPFISPHEEYLALSADPHARHGAYRALFHISMDDELLQGIRQATHAGIPLASEVFKETVLGPLGARIARRKPGPQVEMPRAAYGARRITTLTPDF